MKVNEWIADLLYANFEWTLANIDDKNVIVCRDEYCEKNDAGEYVLSGYIVNKPDADCDETDGFQELEWEKILIPVCVYQDANENLRYEE